MTIQNQENKVCLCPTCKGDTGPCSTCNGLGLIYVGAKPNPIKKVIKRWLTGQA